MVERFVFGAASQIDNSRVEETHRIDSPAVRGELSQTLLGLCTVAVCNIFSSPVIYYCEALMQDRFFGVFH